MSEWISVKDQRPPRGKRVLCMARNGYMVVDSYAMTVGPPEQESYWFDGDSEEYNEDVTHWQPLPKPPNE